MTENPTLLVATRNSGKLKEIRSALSVLPVEIVDLNRVAPDEDFTETGSSFQENAKAKALHYHTLLGLPAIADDSGLVVDALDGEPGIRSSRYLGEDVPHSGKMAHILRRLEGLPEADRSAHFTCALALAVDGRVQACIVKRVFGRIAEAPVGDHGFGYDPIFYCPILSATFGQATASEKDPVSHRGQALRSLVFLLEFHEDLHGALGLSAVDAR